jgi:hypothetical protein
MSYVSSVNRTPWSWIGIGIVALGWFSGWAAPSPADAQGLFEQAVEQSKAPSKPAKESAGGETDKASSVTLGLAGVGFELNGYLRGDIYLGRVPDRDAAQTKSGYGEAALKIRARKGDWGDAFGELRVRGGYEGGETGVAVDLREAYVNAYIGPVDVRLGHQIVVWGRADGVNPTNNLTPRDMRIRSPNEDDMRLANLALRTHLNLDPFRWELVWVPFYAPSHFPQFEIPAGAAPMSITMVDPDWPDTNLKNGTVATRLHLLWPAVECSLSYLLGTAAFPGISLKAVEIQGMMPSAISVAFRAYRYQVVGADFSTALGSFGLRGELAYRHPFDYADYEYTPSPDLQYVFGVDREFFGELSVIAQYSGRAVVDHDREPPSAPASLPLVERAVVGMVIEEIVKKNRMISGQLEQVQHSATLRVEWKLLQEALRLEVMGMVNFSTEELMLRPKVTYDITDALTVTAGAEIYTGAKDTLFDLIEQTQSAGYVELKASF